MLRSESGVDHNSTLPPTNLHSLHSGPCPLNISSLAGGNALTERIGAQAWFDDLGARLDVDKPYNRINYCI